MPIRLAQDFYQQDTIELARGLLGQILVHQLPDGRRLSGRIVETEAYLGINDPAAHSFGGRRTPRTETMFGEAGLSYVYFIYGMYFCFNVVARERDVPEAVLVRAIEPVDGIELMVSRKREAPPHLLANGPGKLCVALGLDRRHNGLDLKSSSVLWIEEGERLSANDIVLEGPRIGLNAAHDASHWPLRYGVRGSPALSPPKFPAP